MTEVRQKPKQNLDLALIGNCSVAALVDRHARLVWWCFPRFDSDPVFSRLLAGDDEKGFCEVAMSDLVESDAHYVRNTALVETILTDTNGAKVRVTDFAPRFERYERTFRPPQIIRRIEPLEGLPRSHDQSPAYLRLRPTDGRLRRRLQSHPLCRRQGGHAPDDGRAPFLHHDRNAVRSQPTADLDLRSGRSVPQRHRRDGAGIPRSDARALVGMVCAIWACRSNGNPRSFAQR